MRRRHVLAAFILAWGLFGLVSAAGAAILITIDKAAQQLSVAVDGEMLWVWPISTGLARYDTPNGRYTPFRMEKDHYSREWDDAPMPHSIFFTRVGHAIHGTNQIKRLGRPASHGCVRLAPENAAALFALVREHGMPNTRVVVDGEIPPPPPPPLVASREPDATAPEAVGSIRRDAPHERSVAAPVPRERPQQHRAARAYVIPSAPARPETYEPPPREPRVRAYRRPQPAQRPRVTERPPAARALRAARAPNVYYDPRVEIIEERFINGTWVRRRYYRQARPSDFR